MNDNKVEIINENSEVTKSKKDMKLIVTAFMFIIPIILGIIFYDRLPSRLAVHFNEKSEANGYAPKWFALFIVPTIILGIHCISMISLKYDPKKQGQSQVIKTISYWICPVLTIGMQITFISYGLGKKYDMSTYVLVAFGILLMILGNYLPKTRYNYTMGIKVPWALANEDNWNKTHRMAGKLWLVCGFVLIVSSIIWKHSITSFIILLIIIVVPTMYSFLLYVSEHRNK